MIKDGNARTCYTAHAILCTYQLFLQEVQQRHPSSNQATSLQGEQQYGNRQCSVPLKVDRQGFIDSCLLRAAKALGQSHHEDCPGEQPHPVH